MMLLSLILGVFISYYFIFVNGLFIKEIGAKNLCYAFLLSGIFGYLVTYIYNNVEKRIGFFKTATYFNFFFVLSIGLALFFYVKKIHIDVVIFIAYTWFWLSSNYLNLVFWKIPSMYFDIGENKQYNGWISTGEVISSIVAYLSVYYLKIKGINLLIFSFSGMIGFFIIFLIIRIRLGNILPQKPVKINNPNPENKEIVTSIWKGKYFQYIFGAIFFAIVIQLLVDYSLLEVTAHDFKNQTEINSYLGKWYTIMRVMEFLFKTVISRYVIKEFGLFIGLISIISVIGIVVIGGLFSMITSITSSILVFATFNKLFERSIFRSVYAPTVNILYQAYPAAKRSISQNFADGYGKTFGQIASGLMILLIGWIESNTNLIPSFEVKMQVVFILIFCVLIGWFIVSKKLISQYRNELNNLIIQMKSTDGVEKAKLDKISWETSTIQEIDGNQKFQQYLGVSSKDLSALKDQDAFTRIINSYQRVFLQKVTDNADSKMDLQDMEVLKHVLYESKKREIIPRSMQFQLNLLMHKESWDYGAEIINGWAFEDVERALFFINDYYKNEKPKDYRITLMYIYVYQVYYEKLPERKKSQELRTLCHLDKRIFSSVISDIDFNLEKETLYQPYIQLLQNAVSHLTYVAACLEDLKDNFPLLNKMLEAEKLQCTQDIINVLRSVHDKDIFDRIIPMIFMGNRSDEVIAAEMLELVLADEEKAWVLPVMREKNNVAMNRKLELDFPQASLSVDARLLSIIGKNSSRLSEFTRLMALACWSDRLDAEASVTRFSALGFSTEPYILYEAHFYMKKNHPAKFAELTSRTGYEINNNSPKGELKNTIDQLLRSMDDIIPISVIDLFLRCKMEDANFLGKDDEGFTLLKKVYRGRQAELDKCKTLFQKIYLMQEHEVFADAV